MTNYIIIALCLVTSFGIVSWWDQYWRMRQAWHDWQQWREMRPIVGQTHKNAYSYHCRRFLVDTGFLFIHLLIFFVALNRS